MKCVCGSSLRKIKTDMDFFDGKIIVKDVEAHYCNSCKEELFTAAQGDEIGKQIKKLNLGQIFKLRKKVVKVGNSFAIPISKDVADFMRMKKGADCQISVKNEHRLIVDVE